MQRRILSLDGGGIRGFFSLEILAKIEALLREHFQKPEMVLADHFHLIAGTSTGAIIASLLSWGKAVGDVRDMYQQSAAGIFQQVPIWRLAAGKYRREGIAAFLQHILAEDDGSPALLGSRKLRTLLLVILRNASRGSAWPVSNNPHAMFNRERDENGAAIDECNLMIPLWKVVRASAAAPWFFPPEEVILGKQRFVFVDGGITPYNNPSLIAAMTATLPAYRIEWPADPEKLLLISIGTGRTQTVISDTLRHVVQRLSLALGVPAGLMESISQEQDMLCRVLGETRFGAPLDIELGTLSPSGLLAPAEKKFSYVRYNRLFVAEEVRKMKKEVGKFEMDNLALIPLLRQAGRLYAEENVRLEHLL